MASGLDQDGEHYARLVHRPPQPVLAPLDLELHFVQVPCVPGSGPAAAQAISKGVPKPPAPAADGLVADRDPPLREQFLHVAVAEEEPVVQPHRMADNLAGEVEALVER